MWLKIESAFWASALPFALLLRSIWGPSRCFLSSCNVQQRFWWVRTPSRSTWPCFSNRGAFSCWALFWKQWRCSNLIRLSPSGDWWQSLLWSPMPSRLSPLCGGSVALFWFEHRMHLSLSSQAFLIAEKCKYFYIFIDILKWLAVISHGDYRKLWRSLLI